MIRLPHALFLDLGWDSTGWCLADRNGPIEAGRAHIKSADRDLDAARLLSFLEGHIRPRMAASALAGHPVRLCPEEAPPVVRMAGAKTLTALQLGRLIGACELWGAQEAWQAFPWRIPVGTWRKWWQLRAKGRYAYKHAAIQLVRARGWGALLDPHQHCRETGGMQADVAEAILGAVKAAEHHHQGPVRPEIAPLVAGVRGSR